MIPKLRSLNLLFFLFLCSPSITAQQSPVIADDATLTQLSDTYSFTEGPAVDEAGNIFFTDQPNNRILKWSVDDGSLSVYMEDAGRANGLYFDNEGNLLAAADEKSELWKIDSNKEITVLLDGFEGKRLNGPNDIWVTPSGGIYFTDPYYQRDYWERTEKEIEQERVYYFNPETEKLKVVADDLVQPNGIIGSPDGTSLYVADFGAKKTYRYTINKDGSLTGKTLFTDMGSDGMTIDNQGNLYLTGNGVTVFNSKGEQIEHIPVDENWTANVTFGGKNQEVLFITASKSLYSLKMKVSGVR